MDRHVFKDGYVAPPVPAVVQAQGVKISALDTTVAGRARLKTARRPRARGVSSPGRAGGVRVFWRKHRKST